MTDFFRLLRVPLVLVATWLVCVTIHEAGHALAAIVTGGKVKSFSIFSVRPHVTVAGSFSNTENAVKAAAGSGIFLAIWLVTLPISVPVGSLVNIRAAGSFFAFIEVLGWVLSSILYPKGPKSNDSWKFIAYSGVDPWIIVLLGVFLLAVGARYFQRSAGFTL